MSMIKVESDEAEIGSEGRLDQDSTVTEAAFC